MRSIPTSRRHFYSRAGERVFSYRRSCTRRVSCGCSPTSVRVCSLSLHQRAMAQLITAKLSRFDAAPWGFRLQGGKDFGTPLLIQKVNGGSLAEKAGLLAGDAVIRVNGVDLYDLRHKDAQDVIVRSGNNLEVVVQRGGSTWKPAVTPVGAAPTAPRAKLQPVTSTSLAANKPDAPLIGVGHNLTPKPFGAAQVNGDAPVRSIVNKQYNSPVGLYSEQTIAETLSAQAEVLAGGVLGVNFKKNEKNYNAENSEVFKMVQEIDKEPREPEPEPVVAPVPAVSGLRHVSAPESTPPAPCGQQDPFKILPPGQNICAECERLIVGVFVRIKEKNLHVECFKCATCGTSLKNVGYYRINEKLYCDVHAKLVARQTTAFSNLEPVTIPPSALSAAGYIKAALPPAASTPAAPGSLSPQPGTLGPLPFHAPRTTPSHVTAPHSPIQNPTSFAGPKLFTVPQISTAHRSPSESLMKTLDEQTKLKSLDDKLVCEKCNGKITGPFISALGKIWCPEHFVCVKPHCRRQLADIGFVEDHGDLYCEYCFEQFLAPTCSKCNSKVKGDCLNAVGKHFHPECFSCTYCGTLFRNNPFFLEDGLPYCESDWNELFTTKCFACGFPIEAGDRWVEALSNNYHSQCFNCSNCKKNLEGQSFYAKGGRPFCKAHAR
ncbi:PDZ and LIM domain protein Zasp isoform X2 [Bacillus rossius redtenbacheri]|uniref:PDZ and LIM domain protein Zasp isoform X2 n=1 Tax=Bacillus rossius redtenbacheri TaxID=93214 RepID=UPI002FDD840A